MSLLDSGPDLVTVYPTLEVDDGYGGTRPGEGPPVTVRAHVQPSDTDQDGAPGYLSGATYRVFSRTLPAGPWSRVDWAGETWTVVGEPQRFGGSARVAHMAATIRRRG